MAIKLKTCHLHLLLLQIIGVFNYLHHEEFLKRVNIVRQNIYSECHYLDEYADGFQNLSAIYKEFDVDYYNTVAELSRVWVAQQLMLIALRYLGSSAANAPAVHQTIEQLRTHLGSIVAPTLNDLKLP